MIKIMLTVRNRLAITKKCIEAILKHSSIPTQIYVYNNQTSFLIDDHFEFFRDLYKNGLISQVTFNTNSSTFGAFSKAVACNMFGLQHEQDPKKDEYAFLLFLDNDIIVTPEWDVRLKQAWKYVRKNDLKNIKVIGQLPGGIKSFDELHEIGEIKAKAGRLGGSGLWSVRPDFFRDVGYLDLKRLVGFDKRHDQHYWEKLGHSSNGKPYILGLNVKLGIHCGSIAGSVCNALTKYRGDNKNREEKIKYAHAEKDISDMPFDQFYQKISTDVSLHRDW